MKIFLYGISLIWIALGSWSILYTTESRMVLKRIIDNVDRKALSAFEAIAGVLLLFAASSSHHAWFLRMIGLMAIIEGGFIFLNPNNLYDEISDWYFNSMSDQTYRFFGIIAIILGTAVLSWIL